MAEPPLSKPGKNTEVCKLHAESTCMDEAEARTGTRAGG